MILRILMIFLPISAKTAAAGLMRRAEGEGILLPETDTAKRRRQSDKNPGP